MTYPIVTALRTGADPILGHLTRRQQLALLVAAMVAVMVWGGTPFLRVCFGGSITR